MKNTKSCKCSSCKNACKYKPGWFIPSQIDSILNYFNVDSARDLFKTGLFAIDWFENYEDEDGDYLDKEILVLAPNIKGNEEIYYPGDPRGECVFYNKKGECDIYELRPFECRMFLHDKDSEIIQQRHKYVASEWFKFNSLEEFRDEIIIEEYSFYGSLFVW